MRGLRVVEAHHVLPALVHARVVGRARGRCVLGGQGGGTRERENQGQLGAFHGHSFFFCRRGPGAVENRRAETAAPARRAAECGRVSSSRRGWRGGAPSTRESQSAIKPASASRSSRSSAIASSISLRRFFAASRTS